jgi:hypothetical protein
MELIGGSARWGNEGYTVFKRRPDGFEDIIKFETVDGDDLYVKVRYDRMTNQMFPPV